MGKIHNSTKEISSGAEAAYPLEGVVRPWYSHTVSIETSARGTTYETDPVLEVSITRHCPQDSGILAKPEVSVVVNWRQGAGV